ncbi:MAG: DUF4845 domain-containing protein [Gammaproteobacteria bacterium]|nr:DUF4845 domain-containing protein [Gammaproteobacteria bacterium]
MITIKKQKGLGLIGTLIFIILAFSAIIIMIKILPSYMENYTLQSVLKSVEKDYKGKEVNQAELRNTLKKRLQVNNIQSVKELDVKIIKNPKSTKVDIDYDVKKPLFGNVALLMSFKETAEIVN